MEGPAVAPAVLSVTGVVLVALHMGRILPPRVDQLCRSTLKSCISLLRGRAGRDKQEDIVRSRVLLWQVEQFRSAVATLALIHLLAVALLLLRNFFGIEYLLGRPECFGDTHMAFVLVGYGGMLLLLLWPTGLTAKSMGAWFWLLMIPVVLSKSPLVCSGTECSLAIMVSRASFTMLCLGCLDCLQTLLAGLAWCASVSTVFVGPQPEGEDMVRWACDMAQQDILICFLVMTGCEFLRKGIRAQVRLVVESEGLQQRQQAFRALLKNFYDVVLELDSDSKIAAGAPEFAAFLLQGSGSTGLWLEGRCFQDFLMGEASALRQRLEMPIQEQQSIGEVVHAQMRSADGERLDVELFCFSFQGLEGRARHVLGIREYSEEMHGVNQQGQATSYDSGEVSVVVAPDPHLTVLDASKNFELLVADAPRGSSLAEQVLNGKHFVDWVQNEMSMRIGPDFDQTAPFPVIFKTKGRVRTLALCTCEEPNEEDFLDEDFLVKLVFRDVERKRRKSLCGSRSGSSVGSSNCSNSSDVLGTVFETAGGTGPPSPDGFVHDMVTL